MFLLVLAHLGSPVQRAVKRLCVVRVFPGVPGLVVFICCLPSLVPTNNLWGINSIAFNRPDALPVIHPTMSKHQKQTQQCMEKK